MKRKRQLIVTIVLLGMLGTAPLAHAEATRTWVSGVGDDANPCSRTAPCQTWAGAISKTAVGGEIDALDPGDFGPVTITKSLTIDGGGGQVASALGEGAKGITISAGSSDIVTIRNLNIDGLDGAGSGSTTGIDFVSGQALHLEHVTVNGWQTGFLNESGSLATVDDSSFQNNTVGINNSGRGKTTIKSSNFDNNATVGVESTGTNGVVNLWNSSVTGAGSGLQPSTSIGASASNSGKLIIANSWFSSAHVDVSVASAGSFVRIANSWITQADTGLVETSGGQIYTQQNNFLIDNTTNGTFTGTFGLS